MNKTVKEEKKRQKELWKKLQDIVLDLDATCLYLLKSIGFNSVMAFAALKNQDNWQQNIITQMENFVHRLNDDSEHFKYISITDDDGAANFSLSYGQVQQTQLAISLIFDRMFNANGTLKEAFVPSSSSHASRPSRSQDQQNSSQNSQINLHTLTADINAKIKNHLEKKGVDTSQLPTFRIVDSDTTSGFPYKVFIECPSDQCVEPIKILITNDLKNGTRYLNFRVYRFVDHYMEHLEEVTDDD